MHVSIRSVENCCSLEIFHASMTDLQGKTQICNYKSCNFAIINHARYYFKGTGVGNMGLRPLEGGGALQNLMGEGGLKSIHGGSMGGGLKCCQKIPVKEFV